MSRPMAVAPDKKMTSDGNNSRNTNARKTCRSLLDAITDPVLIFDYTSFRILDGNKKAAEVYGYTRRQLLNKKLHDLTDDIPSYAQFLHPSPIEATHTNSKGEKLHFLVRLSLIDYWGRKAMVSINRDIQDLKRIQDSIAANEKKFRFLIQNISEIVALIDAQGAIRFISPQVERVLGLSPDEIIGQDVFSFVHPEEQPRARNEFSQTVTQHGQAVPSVLRLKDSSGRWLPFEVVANNQMDEPDVGGVIFTARDLRYRRELEDEIRRANADLDRRVEERTKELARANAALRLENQQRRYTEKQLQESVSLLNATLESTADGILVVSAEGGVRSFNQKFVEMWHIPASSLVSSTDEDLLRWATPQVEDSDAFSQSTRAIYATPQKSSLDTLRLRDGRIFERYSQPQHIGSKMVGRVWSFRDVTQAQTMQMELRQAQKMEAVGRLAGGVAHDFNNVLMLISGYTGQLLEDAQLPASCKPLANQIVAATERAASLTRQLLAFSRKHPVTPMLVDLNGIVLDMKQMLSRLLHDPIRLNIVTGATTLPVYADRSQIELMILNLVLNARDAMPHGGNLTVTTAEEVLDSRMPDRNKGGMTYVVLQISDTGHGMTPDISSHIFEPFFTTKGVGKGTGLGLSTVYGIVEQAGGHITVESEPDQGTSFRVYFPRADEVPVRVMEPGLPVPSASANTETILLVEDEQGIRAMTKTYLQGLGYKVLESENGTEAVRIASEFSGPIHLLLSDIIMPGMRGDDLARLIHQQRPDTAVMFISGYANVHELDPLIPVLEKPFAFPDLGRQVRATLDSATEHSYQQRRVS
jgi:two-component system cell cycle sensor histidine kinase/response regulator CckA